MLLVAFTTATLPINAFGPTPGQLQYYNNGYSSPSNQYGSFSPTPQQNQYNGYDSYNQYNDYNSYNQDGGSFGSTPQQGWGNTNPDGSFYVPQSQCNHSGATNTYVINRWYKEYSYNKHIEYKKYETNCAYCDTVLGHYTENNYEYHDFNNWNQCKRCGYSTGCNHNSTSWQVTDEWFNVYDSYYHNYFYVSEETCNYCGETLDREQKSRVVSHYYQNGRCGECGAIQKTIPQQQYTPPVVNQSEYVEPEEEYVEEPVYVEQPQQNTNTQPNNVVSYQQELEQGITYATTVDGLYLYKRKYNPSDYRGYTDDPYCTLKTAYDVSFLPFDEVLIQKGAYLYRLPEKGGAKVGAAPWIIKACDYRINELKTTLKGLPDALSRVEQYKQVKRGKISLTSIAEQSRTYIATSNQSHSKVSEVQAKLQQLGYTSQKDVTGKIDTKTLNNIAYFQSQNGILSTGWLDNETYNAIMSYGNTPVVNKSPFANITQLYQDGRKLIISAQGNQYTTTLIMMVKGLGGETFYNTNIATKTFSLKENGVYEVELYAKNASGEMYTSPIQTVNVQLPTIIQEVFESYAQEEIMKNEMQAGLLTNLVSNLVLQPAANLANVVDRVIDIDRYGYYDRQQARQEIVDNFRNGAVQYLGNPGYFYVGQVCGDVLSVGAEIYLTASGAKGIVNGVETIKGGAKLVRLQTVGTYQPVVLLVDGVGIATSTTSVLQVGIASNAMLGNIKNAVTGGSNKTTKLYRAVSKDEYESVMSNGKFVYYDNAMEEKWFATTESDAMKWADLFYPDGNYKILEVEVETNSLVHMYYNQHLDNIGPAYCSSLEILENAVKSIKGVK